MTSPPVVPKAPAPAATRATLLEAAGEVFAEQGFHAATVRAICQRAGVNVAAVNYHFGDKERLYLEVLRQAMARAHARHPFDGGLGSGAPARERLRGFVYHFLGRLLDPTADAWLGRLLAREMIDPSPALDLLISERIRPMADQLGDIVREIVGADCPEALRRLCGFSIVSQCLFYNHCRSVVGRMFPEQPLSPEALAPLADHIARFSLAALEALAQRRPPRKAGPAARRKRADRRQGTFSSG